MLPPIPPQKNFTSPSAPSSPTRTFLPSLDKRLARAREGAVWGLADRLSLLNLHSCSSSLQTFLVALTTHNILRLRSSTDSFRLEHNSFRFD